MKNRRLPAEWELQSAVQFTFPHADGDWGPFLHQVIPCFVACIEAASRYQPVLVVCQDRETVRPLLTGARQEYLHLIEIPSNDTWARDHGPVIILEDGAPVVLDFFFNGWGLKFRADRDNLITRRLCERGVFGVAPCQRPGLVLEGGAIESDGAGTILTTRRCLLSPNRNPHLSEAEINAALRRWLGADRLWWLRHGALIGDDTDAHIDTLARFCDAETIAYVQCGRPEDEHYAELKQMETELERLTTRDGQPYRLVPLPLPSPVYAEDGHRLPATYANFLILNGAVLAPVYGAPEDTAALKQLAQCFPDRDIIPVDCRVLIEQHGSLHCISMQYPAGVFFPGP